MFGASQKVFLSSKVDYQAITDTESIGFTPFNDCCQF